MADRRMFSKKLTEKDSFTELPLTAQALYFHFGLRADDDGFCDCVNNTLRMVGATKKDLARLISAGFIYQFSSGVIVDMYWPTNNNIRKDRYHQTMYATEKSILEITQEGTYRIKYAQPNNNQVTTDCQPSDGQAGANCQDRLGKVRLGKDSIERDIRAHAREGPDILPVDNVDNSEINKAVEYYQNHIRPLRDVDERDLIADIVAEFGLQRFKDSVDIAKDNGGRSLKYVDAVCRNPKPQRSGNKKNDAKAGLAQAMEYLKDEE